MKSYRDSLTHEQIHAARAVAAWEWGSPSIANEVLAVAFDEDPAEAAKYIIGEENFDEVWRQTS